MRFLLLVGVFFSLVSFSYCQTGPWAKSSGKLKGEALIRDASGGDLAEVKSIVEGGGDVNWTLDSGLTPLLAAASGGHLEIVRFLLEMGADLNHKDSWGQTALDKARAVGASDVVSFLKAQRENGPPQSATAAETARPSSPPSRPDLGGWPPFGSFQVGDRVQYWLPNGWRSGVVKELGSTVGSSWNEKKYFIASDLFPQSPEWVEWGRVAGEQRAPYWSSFFVGTWRLGEGMAVNTSVSGSTETTEYAYRAATDSLKVLPDGSFLWTEAGQIRQGRWSPASDGPGIVLSKGAQDIDWTFRNETNAIEQGLRRIQSGRLTATGKMSIVATRPTP